LFHLWLGVVSWIEGLNRVVVCVLLNDYINVENDSHKHVIALIIHKVVQGVAKASRIFLLRLKLERFVKATGR
jgi:hypothetical protein